MIVSLDRKISSTQISNYKEKIINNVVIVRFDFYLPKGVISSNIKEWVLYYNCSARNIYCLKHIIVKDPCIETGHRIWIRLVGVVKNGQDSIDYVVAYENEKIRKEEEIRLAEQRKIQQEEKRIESIGKPADIEDSPKPIRINNVRDFSNLIIE